MTQKYNFLDHVITDNSPAQSFPRIQEALESALSTNAGSSAPTKTFPGMLWADWGTGFLKQRNQNDDAWIQLMPLTGVETVPVGASFYWFGHEPPDGFFEEDGAEVSRSTYSALFNELTFTDNVSITDTSTTATMADTSQVEPGDDIEATGIPEGTTVVSVDDSSTITLSNAATATDTVEARFFRFGNGDGSTTFALPDSRGEFMRGWDHGRGVDAGRGLGTTQLDQMQRITGEIDVRGGNAGVYGSASGALSGAGSVSQILGSISGNSSPRIRIDSADSPDARASATTDGETRPRNNARMVIIKY